MKAIYRIFLSLFILVSLTETSNSQIVTDGQLLKPSELRSTRTILLPTLRIPAFDTDSARMALIQQSEKMRVYFFAHKVPVNVNIIKDGSHSTSADGSDIWQYRIKSISPVYSLNFFFSHFKIPEGALLYIYSPDLRECIGGFGSNNNNSGNLLPVMPIASDDVIIYLQCPAGSDRPELVLSEVNLGLRAIPISPTWRDFQRQQISCSPEIICTPNYEREGRAVVLLCVNGISLGTGALINNTAHDGTPYIITASHVMSGLFKYRNYDENAAYTIAFFNYNSPSCSGEIRPSVEQSIAGASIVGVDETTDAVLIKLNTTPPPSYRPYLMGWSRASQPKGPFFNIHHPHGLTKRINMTDSPISLISYPSSSLPFEKDRHWRITWDTGSTAPGSSGSPLFDGDHLFIGSLSGGDSNCNSKLPDYFYTFYNLWDSKNIQAKDIVNALDPKKSGDLTCQPLDLYGNSEPLIRLNHIHGIHNKDSLNTLVSTIPFTQLVNSETIAIGERYQLTAGTIITGFYSIFKNENEISHLQPIKYLISGDESSNILASGEITFDRLKTYNKENNLFTMGYFTPGSKYIEVYTPLATPITLTTDMNVYFGIQTQSIGSSIYPIAQQHQSPNSNTLFQLKGKRWTSIRANESLSGSLWINPIASKPEKKNDISQNDGHLFSLLPNGNHLSIYINSDKSSSLHPEKTWGELKVFNLVGQMLVQQQFKGTFTVLPLAPYQDIGVLIFKIKFGDKEESRKVYLTSK